MTEAHRAIIAPAASVADVARTVASGLAKIPKQLPPWLLYDARGSALFEAITELPEYYPTRAEREIFESHGAAIVAAALVGGDATFLELGAGTSVKTQVLLRAAARACGAVDYVPIDVSSTALEIGRARIAVEEPAVDVTPWAMSHDEAFGLLHTIPGRKVALFIGSSIGNYEGDDAVDLLAGLRAALSRGDALVLGTDLRKDPAVLLPAYDDAQAVTAAFNKNLLTRINRELGGHFNLDRFRHVALWNERASRIEMHLESVTGQVVPIDGLAMRVRLRAGERIHTESSVKYDEAMVDTMLRRAGFWRVQTWIDREGQFAEHLARAL